jgi:hypothetical protein
VRFAPCTWRRGTQVSWLSLKIKFNDLSVVWPQNHWGGFSGLASKPVATVSLLWPQNRWRQFLGGMVTGEVRVEIERLASREDLAACFAWKQVWLEDWQRRDDGWCMWHHHGGYVRVKLKTDGPMR